MRRILYFENCNCNPITVTEVSQLNENNKTLTDIYGNIYKDIVRRENHNANQLLRGTLACFVELEDWEKIPNLKNRNGEYFSDEYISDPIISDPIISNPTPDEVFPDPLTPGPFIPDKQVGIPYTSDPNRQTLIPEPHLPNDNVELSDSVTPNRNGYIPNEINTNNI